MKDISCPRVPLLYPTTGKSPFRPVRHRRHIIFRAILHDETHFPDPFTFNPDRFIKDGALNPDVLDPSVAAFGYGRRICPGRHMARDAVWIAVAYILTVFEIRPARDADGRPIVPSGEYEHVFLRYALFRLRPTSCLRVL